MPELKKPRNYDDKSTASLLTREKSMPSLENHNFSSNKESIKQEVSVILFKKDKDMTLRASCIFFLKDKTNRKRVNYLGLLDTGSTGSLLSKEVVDCHCLRVVGNNGIWGTNTGHFFMHK